VFVDETGFLLRPLIGKTWAPRGETPVFRASGRQRRLSAIGAVTLSPRRKRINLFWQFYDGNVRRPEFVSFLRHLRRTLKTPLVVVKDRLNVHCSAIRLLRDERARWFDPELLPAYAPDLNPVEAVWSCAKRADRRLPGAEGSRSSYTGGGKNDDGFLAVGGK
jgi:transposase